MSHSLVVLSGPFCNYQKTKKFIFLSSPKIWGKGWDGWQSERWKRGDWSGRLCKVSLFKGSALILCERRICCLNLLSKQIHIWTTCASNRDYGDVSETAEHLRQSDPSSLFQGGETGSFLGPVQKYLRLMCKNFSVRWDELQRSSKIKIQFLKTIFISPQGGARSHTELKRISGTYSVSLNQ